MRLSELIESINGVPVYAAKRRSGEKKSGGNGNYGHFGRQSVYRKRRSVFRSRRRPRGRSRFCGGSRAKGRRGNRRRNAC